MKTLLCRFADRRGYEAACPWPFEEGVCQIPPEEGELFPYGPLLDRVASTVEAPVLLPGYWVHGRFTGLVPDSFRSAEADAGPSAPVIPGGEDAPTTEPVPSSVTPLQFRMVLLEEGLLETVEAYVASQPRAVQLAFNHATLFERYSPFITEALPLLNLSPEQVDAMFRRAAVL